MFDATPTRMNIVQNPYLIWEHWGELHACITCGSNPEVSNYIN